MAEKTEVEGGAIVTFSVHSTPRAVNRTRTGPALFVIAIGPLPRKLATLPMELL